jgi:AraC-like DNA-binding protein
VPYKHVSGTQPTLERPRFFRSYERVAWHEIPELQLPSPQHLTKLEPGRLDVSMRMAWLGKSGVTELELSRSASVAAPAFPGYLTLIFSDIDGNSRFFWNAMEVAAPDLINTAELGTSWAMRGSGRMLAITLVLDEWLRSSIGPRVEHARARSRQICRADRRQHVTLRAQAKRALDLVERDPDWLSPQRARLLDNDLGVLAVELIRTPRSEYHTPKSLCAARLRIFNEMISYFDRESAAPLTLTDVASALGTNRRSLNYACHEYFGVAPMEFLRMHRLSAVHRILLQSDPERVTVRDVAADFGFFHPGRFSIAYREHFDELPSQTLRSGKPAGAYPELINTPHFRR